MNEIVEVTGHEAYYDDGELRLTTVYVSHAAGGRHASPSSCAPTSTPTPRSGRAPRSTPPRRPTSRATASRRPRWCPRQDTAVAAALTELGEKVDPLVEVLDVTPGLPADGKLKVRDMLLRVGGTEITERPGRRRRRRRRAGRASRSPSSYDAWEEGGGRRRDPRGGRRGPAHRHHAGRRLRLPLRRQRRHRRQHRRAQRRADDVAGHLRHPHPGLADRRRGHRRHRHDHADRQGRTDRRHPAEDRRRRATPAPSCSSSRPTTATASGEWTPATCAWRGPTTMHGAVEDPGRLGRRPRRRPPQLRGDRRHDEPPTRRPTIPDRRSPSPRTRPSPPRSSRSRRTSPRPGLGPAGPALRPRRHRRARGAGAGAGRRDGDRRPRRRRVLHADRAGRAAARPAARGRRCRRSSGPRASPGARPSSSDSCCRPASTTRSPTTPTAAELFAREHPDRQEVRMVAGATRAGASYCALRLRAHDDEQSVVDGTELVPGLLDLLHATLDDPSTTSRTIPDPPTRTRGHEQSLRRTQRPTGPDGPSGPDGARRRAPATASPPARWSSTAIVLVVGFMLLERLRVLLDRAAVVQLGRLQRGLHDAPAHPHRAVPRLRRPDGGRRSR